jgi:hypothetical protein
MVGFRPVLITGLLLITVSYQAICQTPPKRKGTRMSDSLQLSASFLIEGNDLILNYQVTNQSVRDVYLLNRLYKTTPTWIMTPDVIYIHLDMATKTVWLNKKLADLPMGAGVTAPVAPYISPVRAGGTFQEKVRIPLPVSEYSQYGPAPTANADPSSVQIFNQVFFSVDYYWKPDGTIEENRKIQGTPVIFPRTPPSSPLQFGQLRTKLERINIPVKLSSARGGPK